MSNGFNKDDDSNIYYNIIIEHRGNINGVRKLKRATFSENRVQPILNNPNDYEVGVVRFTVPTYEIPIMFFKDGTGDYAPPTVPTPLFYSVTLSFDGEDITYQLVHVANEFPTTLYGKPAIWYVQEMIDIMNTGLLSAYNALKLAKPLAPPTEAPFFTYDSVTKLITLYAEDTYSLNPAVPLDTIKIYCNSTLFKLIESLESIEDNSLPPNKEFQLLVKNNKLNTATLGGTNYITMTQESETLFLWNDFQSIAFETNTIPVNPEFLPSQNNVIRRIITDFEPLNSDPSPQVIQYFPQGPIRYYDLKSNYPLSSIDLNIVWIDNLRKSYPVYLEVGDIITCKLLFRKRISKNISEVFRREDEELI